MILSTYLSPASSSSDNELRLDESPREDISFGFHVLVLGAFSGMSGLSPIHSAKIGWPSSLLESSKSVGTNSADVNLKTDERNQIILEIRLPGMFFLLLPAKFSLHKIGRWRGAMPPLWCHCVPKICHFPVKIFFKILTSSCIQICLIHETDSISVQKPVLSQKINNGSS
jgi:hypothetical protein